MQRVYQCHKVEPSLLYLYQNILCSIQDKRVWINVRTQYVDKAERENPTLRIEDRLVFNLSNQRRKLPVPSLSLLPSIKPILYTLQMYIHLYSVRNLYFYVHDLGGVLRHC